MIYFREKIFTRPTQKLLFIPGLPGRDNEKVYSFLQKYLPEFQIDYSQDDNINYRQYQGIIGFSLGAFKANECPFPQTPLILISPAFGISKFFHQYSALETRARNPQNLNIYIFYGSKDSYTDRFKPLKANVQYYPGGHAPGEHEVKEYIVPAIKKLFE